MKLFIISTESSRDFAMRLKNSISSKNVVFLLAESESYFSSVIKQISHSDIVLALIDPSFIESKEANSELQIAISLSSKLGKPQLIPVLLDGTTIPNEIKNTYYIFCNTKSQESFRQTVLFIEKEINRKNQFYKYNKINRTRPMLLVTFLIVLFALMFIILYIKEPSLLLSQSNMSILVVGLATVMVALITLIATFWSIMKNRNTEEIKRETELYSRRLKEAISPVILVDAKKSTHSHGDEKPQLDALGRMLINLEDIKEFYTWSQKQAKASFILAVVMCIFGFALMVGAILLPILFNKNIQMSIIPAIGGAIAELVAGTALFVYRSSLGQLNHYHKALHEDERFLSSVNLIGKFNITEMQDEMLKEIIKSEIDMNLAELNNR